MKADREGKPKNSKADKSFISVGFCNWKDTTTKFKKHEDSASHNEAIKMTITLPKETKDIGETLSDIHKSDKCNNWKQLLRILSSIWYLARQGMALWGDGDEDDSNWMKLWKTRAEEEPTLTEWLDKKTDKLQGGHPQAETKFPDFSLTFPWPNSVFHWPKYCGFTTYLSSRSR